MVKIKKINLGLLLALIFSMLFTTPILFAVDTHTVAQKKELCGSNAGFDVKGSFILSVVTLCLPGVLDKVNDWYQIKCQRIQCMYDSVIADRDPAFCATTEAYGVCTQIIGEMFAIPPMAILEYFRKMIAQILANPKGVAYAAGVAGARYYIQNTCSKSPCADNYVATAAAFLLTANDIAAVTQRLKDISENGLVPKKKDYCANIPKIAEEMRSIVSATSESDVQSHLN